MTTANWQKLRVLCDEPADRALFLRIKKLSPSLSQIPDTNVKVYPAKLQGSEYALIQPLMIDDRPDFIVLHDRQPLLVVELTEHGYTGDNPLQRFTRLAAAAENGVPVIYFGPFARVRDDELDLVDDPDTLSRRRVNTDLFRGMHRLSEVHNVPMAAAEWITGANGKPLKLPLTSSDAEIKRVFGHLISRMEVLLQYSTAQSAGSSTAKLQTAIDEIDQDLANAYANPNVRGSQTKILLDGTQTITFTQRPASILDTITRADYFYKDKPERLLALLCILHSDVRWIKSAGDVSPVKSKEALQERLLSLLPALSDGSAFYYTGYKWRSDPHCGVLVNFDYLHARQRNERSVTDRQRPLILFYPRIYLDPQSANVTRLQSAISLAAKDGSQFNQLFVERYGAAEAAKRAPKFLRNTSGHLGRWTDTTKQARIFQRYCDLIFLQDAVILGHHHT